MTRKMIRSGVNDHDLGEVVGEPVRHGLHPRTQRAGR